MFSGLFLSWNFRGVVVDGEYTRLSRTGRCLLGRDTTCAREEVEGVVWEWFPGDRPGHGSGPVSIPVDPRSTKVGRDPGFVAWGVLRPVLLVRGWGRWSGRLGTECPEPLTPRGLPDPSLGSFVLCLSFVSVEGLRVRGLESCVRCVVGVSVHSRPTSQVRSLRPSPVSEVGGLPQTPLQIK